MLFQIHSNSRYSIERSTRTNDSQHEMATIPAISHPHESKRILHLFAQPNRTTRNDYAVDIATPEHIIRLANSHMRTRRFGASHLIVHFGGHTPRFRDSASRSALCASNTKVFRCSGSSCFLTHDVADNDDDDANGVPGCASFLLNNLKVIIGARLQQLLACVFVCVCLCS